MEFQEGRGVFEVAALALCAVGLDVAERVEALLELAGEALAVHAKGGEGAVGVDDVKVDCSLIVGWIGGAVGGWLLAIGTGIGFVMRGASDAVLAWAGGDFARGVRDAVDWDGKIGEEVA